MSDLEQSQKHALECLRLEADCKQLADRVHNPSLQSHFLRMAAVWSALAVSQLSANASDGFSNAETLVT
jgi:hypothetical protein